ncbi:MAG: hypothetical protein HN712_04770 [Gemmatimonadetes bacterium]|jgi:hypothetical protein|nr:hypothetical protein [Gemmatimonadota bacterium]MBT7859599.1 hypothetical protein [Gemmatimonadota bacterium]
MLDRATSAHIERQLQQLARLETDYDELLRASTGEEPELVGRTALSAVVQSFYQGVEGIFQTIAKRVDGSMPSSADWHRRLLQQMAAGTDGRPEVISLDVLERLEPFLGFRHLARHTYPFLLDWARMRDLVREIAPLHTLLRRDLEKFIKTMGE